MIQLTPELEARLAAAVERMPAFPKSVQTILEMTRRPDCLPKALVGVIEKDPVMTMKILRIVNSAWYGLPNRINSVAQAVVYLGINTVKNLALTIAAVGMLPRENDAGFDIQGYLVHSLSVAAVARLLCEKFAHGEADPGDCYIAGLLHDFGKVVLARFLSAEFALALLSAREGERSLDAAERRVIGVDHAHVGARLAQKWQFGQSLVVCIRDHHDETASPSAMLDCLRVADALCRWRGYGDAGNPWHEEEAARLPARFGNELPVLAASLAELAALYDEAQRFAQIRHAGEAS